jgi:DNA modification methylase
LTLEPNQVYLGDNLEILSRIETGVVDVVYVDPPFSTGRNFYTKDKQFAYSDKLSLQELLLFLVPRLRQIHRVMKSSGMFYLHGDGSYIHYAKLLCDAVFGEGNFRNEIIWHYNSSPRKKNDLGKRHDTILRYSKTDVYKFRPIRVPYAKSAPRGYAKEKYYHPHGKVIGDVWDLKILGQNDKAERCGYPTQKPLSLLQRIIKLSSDEGDLVLDCFSGSGTTCLAAKTLNRNWIGIDSSPIAVSLSRKRLLS